jgi:F-type H+-transporting ATPase subunit epsilon
MFKLSVVTPEKRLLTDAMVNEVFVPAYRGELEILPGHAPLVTTLRPGVLRYQDSKTGEMKAASISWGYCEVLGDQINILAETAEAPSEIDIERADLARKTAEQELGKVNLSETERKKYESKLHRAQARLNLVDALRKSSH